MYILEVSINTCFLITNFVHASDAQSRQPHIVIILADDLGWNDVSFHGANQIPTPNIDALAYNGVILNRVYTLHSCTPSRAALLTRQYPMRLGFQGLPILSGVNRHLPLDVEILPEKLKQLGYSTQLVGKWHLRSAYKNVTPTIVVLTTTLVTGTGTLAILIIKLTDMHGLDMHNSFEPQWSTQNQYVTHLFTQQVEEVISMHNSNTPLFLMVSHMAPHAGKNGTDLEVPDVAENNKKFSYIQDANRRIYAGGHVSQLGKMDGMSQWPALIADKKSNRTKILLNIDEIHNSSALIIENGRYKLVNGATLNEPHDGFYGEDGRDYLNPPYDAAAVLESATNAAVDSGMTEDKVWAIRNASDIGDCRHNYTELYLCTMDTVCLLFDLVEDPCETTNLAEELPHITKNLFNQLLEYWKGIQPQMPTFIYPKANPIYFNNSWSTWLENS